jgi:hypothetical protein
MVVLTRSLKPPVTATHVRDHHVLKTTLRTRGMTQFAFGFDENLVHHDMFFLSCWHHVTDDYSGDLDL